MRYAVSAKPRLAPPRTLGVTLRALDGHEVVPGEVHVRPLAGHSVKGGLVGGLGDVLLVDLGAAEGEGECCECRKPRGRRSGRAACTHRHSQYLLHRCPFALMHHHRVSRQLLLPTTHRPQPRPCLTVLMLSLKVWPSPLTRRWTPSAALRSRPSLAVRAPQKPPPCGVQSGASEILAMGALP